MSANIGQADTTPRTLGRTKFDPKLVDAVATMIWERPRDGELEGDLALRILERAAREWSAHGLPKLGLSIE